MKPVSRACFGVLLWTLNNLFNGHTASPPPVVNYTVITLYTKLLSWHDARHVCEASGGKLLDISYYSMFSFFFTPQIPEGGPWDTLPLANGGGAWISMHRRITPLGDHFYDGDCLSLEEFNIADWQTADGLPDGEAEDMCVTHEVLKTVTQNNINYKSDYNRAECSELRRFYCEHTQGPCTFEEVATTRGNTQYDFSPSNDISISFVSLDDCKQHCFNSSYTTEYTGPPRLDVTEECWGFTVSSSICTLHLVIKARYFDTNTYARISSSSRTLYIKRCFEGAVNSTEFEIEEENLTTEPNTTCGIPIIGNSTTPSTRPVFVHSGSLTWNDAFTTCSDAGQHLLNIYSEEVELTLQSLIEEYLSLGLFSEETLWLGIHEPDPQSDPDVRVWSDCEGVDYAKWDPSYPPSYSVYDSALCTVVNTTSMLWRTEPCNELHQFICVGDEVMDWAYDTGTNQTLGVGTTLGPYTVSSRECRFMCSNWTFEDEDCWAYGYMEEDSGTTFCRLYFASNVSFYQTSYTAVTESYTFYRKKIWHDTFVNTTFPSEDDDSIFPYSCCDVSNISITSQCPPASMPSADENVPTSEALEFILFTKPATWNQAQSQCEDSGGTLVEIDSVNKYHALQFFLTEWDTQSILLGPVWTGLIQANGEDDCSYRWGSDCRAPSWLYVENAASNSHCGVYRDKTTHELRACNDTYQYVCQRQAGSCTMSEVATDHYCGIENYMIVSIANCYDLCRTQTYNGKECWAIMELNRFNCALLFYTDPMYCREIYYYDRGQDATFKTCHTSSTNSSDISAETNSNASSSSNPLIPLTNCTRPFVFPYTRNASVCEADYSPITGTIKSATTEAAIISSTVFSTSTNTNANNVQSVSGVTSNEPTTRLVSTSTAPSGAVTSNVPPTNVLPTSSVASNLPTNSVPSTSIVTSNVPTTSVQPSSTVTSNLPTTGIPPTGTASSNVLTTGVPPTSSLTTNIPTTGLPPTSIVTSNVPTTSVPPSSTITSNLPTTGIPPTSSASSNVPTTGVPQTSSLTSNIPTTGLPPTSTVTSNVPTPSVPPSSTALSSAPTTSVPPTTTETSNVPTTSVPQSSTVTSNEPTQSVQPSSTALSSAPTTGVPSTTTETSNVPTTSVPQSSTITSNLPTTAIPPTSTGSSNVPTTGVPQTSSLTSNIPTTGLPPTSTVTSNVATPSVPPSSTALSSAQTTGVPPTTTETSNVPTTSVPQSSTVTSNEPTQSVQPSSTALSSAPITGVPSTTTETSNVPTTSVPQSSTITSNLPTTAIPPTSTGSSNVPTTGVPQTSSLTSNIPSTGLPLTSTVTSNVPTSNEPPSSTALSSATTTVVPPTTTETSNVPTVIAPPSSTVTSNVPTSGVPISSTVTSNVHTTGVPPTGTVTSNVQTTGVPPTSSVTSNVPTTGVPPTSTVTSNVPTTGVPPTGTVTSNVPTNGVPPTSTVTSNVLTTGVPPTSTVTSNVPTSGVPPTSTVTSNVQTTGVPPTSTVSSNVQTAGVPPTFTVTTNVTTTGVPPTSIVTSNVPTTGVLPTSTVTPNVPTTGVPPTSTVTSNVPTTGVPPTSIVTSNVPTTSVLSISTVSSNVPTTAVPPTSTVTSNAPSSSTIPNGPTTNLPTATNTLSTNSYSSTSNLPILSSSVTNIQSFSQAVSHSTVISVSNTPTTIIQSSSNILPNQTSTVQTLTNTLGRNAIKPIFLWPCLCFHGLRSNMTLDEWNQWLASTSLIDRKALSKFRRTRECADDNRKSAVITGVVGASVLSICSAFFFVADLFTLISNLIPAGSKYVAS